MDSRKLLVITVAASMLLAWQTGAARAHHRPSSYCSPSGDICQSVTKIDGVRKLRIIMDARYFGRYILCLKSPSGVRSCEKFRVQEWDDGLFGDSIKWRRHFGSSGEGRYTVTWYRVPKQGPPRRQIGQTLSFRLGKSSD